MTYAERDVENYAKAWAKARRRWLATANTDRSQEEKDAAKFRFVCAEERLVGAVERLRASEERRRG